MRKDRRARYKCGKFYWEGRIDKKVCDDCGDANRTEENGSVTASNHIDRKVGRPVSAPLAKCAGQIPKWPTRIDDKAG